MISSGRSNRIMGGLLFKSLHRKKEQFFITSAESHKDLENYAKPPPQSPSRRTIKLFRHAPKAPKFVLYDMEEFKRVEDHEGVRRLLLRIPEWVPQTPTDAYIEYWYYFHQEGQTVTPSMRLYPAARARLPWPQIHTASPENLLCFVHSVNRIAHRQLLSLVSAGDESPHRRQQKPNFRARFFVKSKRLAVLDRSVKRTRSWREMSQAAQRAVEMELQGQVSRPPDNAIDYER